MDVLSFVRGEYFALSFRRGITHGVPAMLVLPFVVAGAMLAWDRLVRRPRSLPPARPGAILGLSALGVLTHPALDWMNVYGMRWWLPFDPTWTYGDALFIIDPWLWLLLGAAAFVGASRTRSTAILQGMLCAAASLPVLLGPVPAAGKVAWTLGLAGAIWLRRRVGDAPRATRRAAGTLTATAAVYVLAMVGAAAGARANVERAAASSGLTVTEVMISPAPAAPLSADVEVVTPDGYVPGTHRWLGDPRVTLHPDRTVPHLSIDDPGPAGVAGHTRGPGDPGDPGNPGDAGDTGDAAADAVIPAGAPTPVDPATAARVVEAARRVSPAREWLVWSRYPYARVRREPGGWLVRFGDARYDDRGGAGSLAGVEVRLPDGGL